VNESAEGAIQRWAKLKLVQEHYKHFVDFLRDGMLELGFEATEIQEEIGDYLEHGPQNLMVQAQRSQAKTTVAALFVVWSLIHNPHWRMLIVSAGGTQANEISTLIVRVILSMNVLECMRPDKMAGDKTSVEHFDVHHSLKGLDKSPSVACIGIGSNMQGKRADILLADDIESSKNSATPVQRAQLLHLTRDFASICQNGRILWLGTPQTMDSIYNSLPARGVAIRIWPGRYPTPEQREFYGNRLAPSIVRALDRDPSLGTGGGVLCSQGQPLDPQLLDELALQRKELDQGEAYFQLQHMLNTKLSDALRYPLKPEHLIVMPTDQTNFPLRVVRGMQGTHARDFAVADHAFKMMAPHDISPDVGKLQSLWAYIDPAAGGANADETAWAIGGFLNSAIWLLSCGGMPGGYDDVKMDALARILARFPLSGVKIERNLGFGAFRAVFIPILRKHLQCDVQDDQVAGQKELRIISTLAPIMGRGALIVDERVVAEDQETVARYSPSMRQSYSLFFQLSRVSAVRGALVHDDRADALEGLCRHYQEDLALDQSKAIASLAKRRHEEMMKDPLGHQRFRNAAQIAKSPFKSILGKRRR
jgi:hypothetical protein